MNLRIDTPRDQIAAFCGRWQVTELALFGSVLREDFGPDSDIDVLCALIGKRGTLSSTLDRWKLN